MAYERILRRFRECVRTRAYVITIHAEQEMSADGYSIFDVEQGVLTGKILERQKDEESGRASTEFGATRPLTDGSSWLQNPLRPIKC